MKLKYLVAVELAAQQKSQGSVKKHWVKGSFHAKKMNNVIKSMVEDKKMPRSEVKR